MRVAHLMLAAFALAAAAAFPAAAQRATEQYIPIGQSPGVSGVSTEMGVVTRVNERSGSVTIDVDGRQSTFVITRWTDVWLDRSAAHQSNEQVGEVGLRVGDTVEIKRGDPVAEAVSASLGGALGAGPPVADWIKIQASAR